MRKTVIAAAIAAAAFAARAGDVIYLQGGAARAALSSLEARLKQSPDDAQAHKEAGILLHQMSRGAPDKARVEQGEAHLKQAAMARPVDAETRAWLGSITTMKAIFETDAGRQTFYVKLGARYMDRAVQQAPDNRVVRLVRANNSLELPAFLKRSRFAVEDYAYYLALCEKQACPPAEVNAAKRNLPLARQRAAETL